ncbi:hypothetical protein EDD36DRAFT_485668 [Exophiala viscosa]|uniref:Fungal N-terminal domain-containing protein n=1 Tax=Exophiala viscosa TaxID=2486360 RepID=A0AAN6IEV1_9EURO|nr:hypothetical protein EDD36DRAFT_485668 [Exophiala viscosa]
MAEIGLLALGVKLSLTLYTFSETVSTADENVKNIARDVSLTSSVLEVLGANLRQDDHARLSSSKLLQTAGEVVAECETVFKNLDDVMRKAMTERASKRGMGTGILSLSAVDKLKWPFIQPKVELLRTNLERLKSTLVLMLNVLTYARDLKAEKKQSSQNDDGYQKTLVEDLIRANQETTKNYQTLLKTITARADNPGDGQYQLRDMGTGTSAGRLNLMSMKCHNAPSISQPGTDDKALNNASSLEAEVQAASTISACLRRIEVALLQFEQDAGQREENIRVRITLKKQLGTTGSDPTLRLVPWQVLSITQTRIWRRWFSRALIATPSRHHAARHAARTPVSTPQIPSLNNDSMPAELGTTGHIPSYDRPKRSPYSAEPTISYNAYSPTLCARRQALPMESMARIRSITVEEDIGVDQLLKEWTTLYDDHANVGRTGAK